MALFLSDKGYNILISEWCPIVKYGTTHKWKCFKKYPECSIPDDAWGNFIAIRDKKIYDILVDSVYGKA